MRASEQREFFFFTKGKTELGLSLFDHFVATFESIGSIKLEATKTMIGISNGHKRIAWITQIGKNFIHVVFPFKNEYKNNLCFQKVGHVPGDSNQVNHHFRMIYPEDLNEEVLKYMTLAYNEEK